MVKRVYGKLDGINIILAKDGDNWSIPVPFNEDGEYIFEIISEDEAGNTSYLTKMLFIVNKTVVTTYLIPLDYPGELLNIYAAHIMKDSFTTELVTHFSTHCLSRSYSVEVLTDI